MTRRACIALAVLTCCATSVCRADDVEAAGLALADATPVQTVDERNYRFSIEPGLRLAEVRPGGGLRTAGRLSLDLFARHALAGGWSVNFADRLDLNGPLRFGGDAAAINTLKELYLDGRLGGGKTLLQAGRVNVRLGVAIGYNPTDFLRDNAVRSVTSVDPASLRENRLGTVMLRGQQLWSGGSASALVAPRVADRPSDASYSPDFGATNQRTRWLLQFSQRMVLDLTPQFMVYHDGKPGSSPQFGLTLDHLVNNACVTYAEWSGGRGPSTLARALGRPYGDVAFRWKLAAGLTCTTSRNLSVTLEYDRDGAALDRAGWRALRSGPPAAYAAYRALAAAQQDPVTRDAVFMMARWQDAWIQRLDLSGFVRMNLADRSRLTWLEARYRFARTDVALQWQIDAGASSTEFGALPQSNLWQLLVKHYL
ncbi:hypothetical protein [Burkholderia glumae]|uniref:hypothetical protein n=1 Tax=Burkholderia glumae TaxID=337 RepID=UPI00148EA7CE|nr:hypothetical protein [Burkholderia glumae]QJW80088.1 hypothetical protein GAS18_15955 [Burkholderia glumae]